jgi:hypothetical protein
VLAKVAWPWPWMLVCKPAPSTLLFRGTPVDAGLVAMYIGYSDGSGCVDGDGMLVVVQNRDCDCSV